MSGLGPRLIAYGLIGLFCIPGPVGLIYALDMIAHRAAFIHAALRAEGTVTGTEPVRTTRTGAGTEIPVFRFTANDGRLHIIHSDISVPHSTFTLGEAVGVLYLPRDPEKARINAFSTLWQGPLIVSIWGAVWSLIPLLILIARRRGRPIN
jgi:hypothetical protein